MASVYLAEDLKHDRKVALKVLKPELAAVVGAERFLAEIKTTANLQHPHILPLFDSGEADGLIFYVMPYMAGESLRDRLDREKQLPVDEAVSITLKVLSALEHAHGQGVVHRDVKPANILLSPGGEPLVADFGIALAVSHAGDGRITETGLSLGTPDYMSPEQATGDEAVDPRSDVYAVGCTLYEMLAGQPPFTGRTAQAILSRMLTEDAPSVTASRKAVPPHVSRAIERALERLPADRFQSADAFAEALRNPGSQIPSVAGERERSDRRLKPVAIAGWGLSALLLAFIAMAPEETAAPAPAPLSFYVDATQGGMIRSADPPQISPDGSILTFVAVEDGTSFVEIRRMSEPVPRRLEGTEGARDPFFSPDGSRVAFFSESGLRSVDWETGFIETLAGPEGLGTFQQAAIWLAGGMILFTHEDSPAVWGIVPGDAAPQRMLDPSEVPGAVRFRIQAPTPVAENRALVSVDLGQDRYRPGVMDVEAGTFDLLDVRGVPVGYWDGTLALLDSDGVRLRKLDSEGRMGDGDALPLGPEVGRLAVSLAPQLKDLSLLLHPAALVALRSGGTDELAFGWMDREGDFSALDLPRGAWRYPRLSPDGTRILVGGGPTDLDLLEDAQGIFDIATGAWVPLEPGGEHAWGPDGDYAYFTDGINRAVSRQRTDGASPLEIVLGGLPAIPWVTSVSPDGSTVLFYNEDIRALDVASAEARVLIDDAGIERNAEFSPDGRYIAYSSTGSGREEVYVKPYPSLDRRFTVSTEGGEMPIWSRDGTELFFVSGDRLMVTRGVVDGVFTPGRPVELFRGGFRKQINGDQSYDSAPDGRLLVIRGEASTMVEVHTGWLEAALAEVGADPAEWGARR